MSDAAGLTSSSSKSKTASLTTDGLGGGGSTGAPRGRTHSAWPLTGLTIASLHGTAGAGGLAPGVSLESAAPERPEIAALSNIKHAIAVILNSCMTFFLSAGNSGAHPEQIELLGHDGTS